ncbi:hypothetical protein B0H14DRAFT_3433929 [Mycena olivaceomarginata]|nr:hypothetical protein B0H14DRAFT_3433929 [Mycena olivaceomarginata]
MANSLSTSDCFTIELMIPTLDADTELADTLPLQAIGVRVRYLTRHRLVPAPTVGAVVHSDRPSQSASTYGRVPELFRSSDATPSFISVHADRGPNPARNTTTYDEFLTTTIKHAGTWIMYGFAICSLHLD